MSVPLSDTVAMVVPWLEVPPPSVLVVYMAGDQVLYFLSQYSIDLDHNQQG
jgi:hypothetical protein